MLREYSIIPKEREFWENLDIPVDDALEFEKPKKRPWLTLFYNISKYPGMYAVINREDKKDYDFKAYFKHLFKHKKIQFYRTFFLVELASKLDNNSIKSKLPKEIEEIYSEWLNKGEISYSALLYPIFKLNKELLTGIFYDSLITKASLKTFQCQYSSKIQKFLKQLDEDGITKFFSLLQSDGTMRRNFQLWWFEKKDNKIKILIRTESKRRQSIHQVTKNTFLKTAGDKIMVFSEDGTQLQVLSKDAITVAKWASKIVGKAIGKEITYEPIPDQYTSDEMLTFISKVRKDLIDNVKLLGIEICNTPLASAPNLSVESNNFESISAAVDELENDYKLPIISNMEDITSFTLSINDISYKISTSTENGLTTIMFNNKNLRENQKNKFREVINSTLRKT